MLQELVIFAALGTVLASLLLLLPGVARSPIWLALPLVAVALAVAGWLAGLMAGDLVASLVCPPVALVVVGLARVFVLRRWSLTAVLLVTLLVAGSALYIVFAAVLTAVQPLGVAGWIGSLLLLLLEITALAISISYSFELLDVLGRKDRPYRSADEGYRPPVAIQVPAYNEPIEVVEQTLRSLAALEYERLLVQVVDNNTEDEAVWKPLEALCEELGPRFQFIHLENWPGYKAGALNEATRRLPPEYEVIGIVDADYVVDADFVSSLVGLFADAKVAFVQSSQNYRDWRDDAYLRGLFYSYRYFFDVSMPSRAQRNAIIFAGTMGLVRRSALDEIGGWNQACVTEDAEASLRLLGRGYTGVYDRTARGAGLMPLSFDGLKKQRFRWALGGVQMLRMHWRELLPFGAHDLKLSTAQRLHYLMATLQWFAEALTLVFTLLLLVTAAFLAVRHQLPVRQLVGAVVVVPLVFLFMGLLRAVWGLRSTTGCRWQDALRALSVWLALSWVVTLACVRGLARPKAAFLRTPKRKEGVSTIWQALRSCKAETLLSAVSLIGAIVILVSALSPPTVVLALLLLYQAAFYACAPWASLAAEGVTLTEFRKIYGRSAQNTGERPDAGAGIPLPVRTSAALLAAAFLGLLFATAQPARPAPRADLPPIGQVAGKTKVAPTPAVPGLASPQPSPTGQAKHSPSSSSPAPTGSPGP